MATSYPKSLQGAMDQMMSDSDTSECPAPTQDITLNLKNRAKAITAAKYGPENPNLPRHSGDARQTLGMRRLTTLRRVAAGPAQRSMCLTRSSNALPTGLVMKQTRGELSSSLT